MVTALPTVETRVFSTFLVSAMCTVSTFSEGELASGELGLMKEDGGQLVVGEGGLKLKDGPVPCKGYSCLLTAQQVSGGTVSGRSG